MRAAPIALCLVVPTGCLQLVPAGCARWFGPARSSIRSLRLSNALTEADDSRREVSVEVLETDGKGRGAFAAAAVRQGEWVCQYQGAIVEEGTDEYERADPAYLFKLGNGLHIDGTATDHFSRFINHDEHGNLDFEVDPIRRRVDFFARRAIAPGEELSFDYGVGYWVCSAIKPAAATDSRSFSLAEWQPPPLAEPPPPTPRTSEALDAALRLPEEQARAALLRCLEYFGGCRVGGSDLYEIPLELPAAPDAGGDGGAAPRRERVNPQTVALAKLEEAATRCVAEAERRAQGLAMTD